MRCAALAILRIHITLCDTGITSMTRRDTAVTAAPNFQTFSFRDNDVDELNSFLGFIIAQQCSSAASRNSQQRSCVWWMCQLQRLFQRKFLHAQFHFMNWVAPHPPGFQYVFAPQFAVTGNLATNIQNDAGDESFQFAQFREVEMARVPLWWHVPMASFYQIFSDCLSTTHLFGVLMLPNFCTATYETVSVVT